MPEPSTLLLFAASAAALVLIPGPNLVFIVTRSIEAGRHAGLASMLDVETATLVHVTAAAVGLSALLASSAVAFETVRWAGIAYLVYLGVGAAAQLRRGRAREPAQPQGRRLLPGLPSSVRKPEQGSAGIQVLALGAVFMVIASLLDLLYVFAAGLIGQRLRGGRRFAGGVYLALAVLAAATGGRRS